ncbi:hypothetical protein BGZ49_000172, partial [Haplosporangium sp. Z 27]
MSPSRRFIVTCSHHCHCQHGHSSSSSDEETSIVKKSSAATSTTTTASSSAALLPTPPSSPRLNPSTSSAPDSPVFSTNIDAHQSLPEPL